MTKQRDSATEHIVIIGNGIAGITCAREVRKKSAKRITVISGESEFFFSRTALMYVYMGHMKFDHIQPYEDNFWRKNRIELVQAWVKQIDPAAKKVELQNGTAISYDKLVIATGSQPNKTGVTGEQLKGVLGMYSKQDLEHLEELTSGCKHAVIIGGGLIGIELAEMLHSRKIGVTFIVRENGFWGSILPPEEAALINRHIREHGIDLRLATTVTDIAGDTAGRVSSVVTNTGERIDCQVVGLTTGVSPNIGVIENSGIHARKGVLVNTFLETNIKDIYAIGDCAEQTSAVGLRKPVEAVWYTGRIMGETLANTLCGERSEYGPGHWFNSAKFFDIEYQTYGWVFARPLEYEAQFFWQHPDGKKSLRFSFHRNTRKFLGVVSLGIRLRQEFFNAILDQDHSIDTVIRHLRKANFDPEFYERHETVIQAAFKSKHQLHAQQV
ncbi:MAG: FAD-dependent oxidoreductase [Bacteroidota bacterium]